MNDRTHAVRRGKAITLVQPSQAPDELNRLFNEYFEEKSFSPEQAKANGCIPVYDDDPRAQAIGTVSKHTKRRNSEGKPRLAGFLIEYSPTFHTFRYLCDEEYYPIDEVRHKAVKLVSPSGVSPPVFQPKCLPDSLPPGARVRICESAVKAIASSLSDSPALGLNGAAGGIKNKKLHPDLERLFKKYEWIPVITLDANAHAGSCLNSEVAKHQRNLIVALYDMGIPEVYVSCLPPYRKRDQGIDDYLGRGGCLEDLPEYLADEDGTVSVKSIDMTELDDAKLSVATPIVENFLGVGQCAVLTSAGKMGKTRIALSIALAVAAGNRNLFDHPNDLKVRKTEVLVFLLEDDPVHIRENLKNFARSMSLPWPIDGLHLITDVPEGAWVLHKVAVELKKNPKIKMVILDNETIIDVKAGRPNPSGTLVQQEYAKRNLYTRFAREHNVGVYLLAHSRKGVSSTTMTTDMGNSTGTAAAAVDHVHGLKPMSTDCVAPETARLLSISGRTYKSQDIVLNIPPDGGAPVMIGTEWELSLTKKLMEYLQAVAEIARERGGIASVVKSSDIAAKMGVDGSTVINTMNKYLIPKGWIDSAGSGASGGYKLSTRAANTNWAVRFFNSRF